MIHNVYSREIIRPSSPTPDHLKRYNLLYVDKLVCRNYIPIVFFYPSFENCKSTDDESRHLKRSLSETLTKYYHFAGRFSPDGPYVDCNDQGIEYEEARIECQLSDILTVYENEDASDLESVFPRGSIWGTFGDDSSLVIVRVNYFGCGGIAIAVCLSHRIADGCTFANFMNYWAAVATSGKKVLPHFIYSTEPNEEGENVNSQVEPQLPGIVKRKTKRYIFKNTEIEHLKARVTNSGNGQSLTPTRFEILAALFYKCAMATDKKTNSDFSPSVLIHPVNMRSKLEPQLPPTSVGNFLLQVFVQTRTESESSLSAIIGKLRNGKLEKEGLQILAGEKILTEDMSDCKMYMCGSMCNLGFYDVNFGRGKPLQVAHGDAAFDNCFHFMDTPNGDGIEALVRLEQQELLDFYLRQEIDSLY